MTTELTIRPAVHSDLPAITAIYGEAVTNGTASFELEPPDMAEMTRRFNALYDNGYPYLVATIGETIVGYAYAGPYRPRPAYRLTVEDSVYIAAEARGLGVGKALLGALIKAATAVGFRQMIAVIGDVASQGSIALHRGADFDHVGRLKAVGYKHGKWRDSVIMQRALGISDAAPPDVVKREIASHR